MPNHRPAEVRGALLIIDQEPVRRAAADEVRSLFARLRRARRKVEDFEAIDQPAFARWLRSEFHELVTGINALTARVTDAEDLVREVQTIRLAVGCSYHQAYVNAMERRRLGEPDREAERDGCETGENSDGRGPAGDGEEEGRARGPGAGEDGIGGEDDVNGGAEGSEFARGRSADGDDGAGLLRKARNALDGVADSLKSKYRELARLLHPDLRFGGDAWTNDLWARTQTAYAERDLRGLDDLLVLSRVSLGSDAGGESVSDMKSAAAFLKKSLSAVRRQTTRLKRDMAWGFSGQQDRARLQRRISYDLESERDELSERLEALEAQLARWSVPPRPRRSSPSRRRSSWDLDF